MRIVPNSEVAVVVVVCAAVVVAVVVVVVAVLVVIVVGCSFTAKKHSRSVVVNLRLT